MTDIKFKILELIYRSKNRKATQVEIFNAHLNEVDDTFAAISDMLRSEPPLIVEESSDKVYRITIHGNIAYEQEAENRQREAYERTQREREYRFNKRTTIISTCIAAVATLVALGELIYIIFEKS